MNMLAAHITWFTSLPSSLYPIPWAFHILMTGCMVWLITLLNSAGVRVPPWVPPWLKSGIVVGCALLVVMLAVCAQLSLIIANLVVIGLLLSSLSFWIALWSVLSNAVSIPIEATTAGMSAHLCPFLEISRVGPVMSRVANPFLNNRCVVCCCVVVVVGGLLCIVVAKLCCTSVCGGLFLRCNVGPLPFCCLLSLLPRCIRRYAIVLVVRFVCVCCVVCYLRCR